MKEKIIKSILQRMQDKINNKQLEELKIILIDEFSSKNKKNKEKSNDKLEKLFIDAKRLEGCSISFSEKVSWIATNRASIWSVFPNPISSAKQAPIPL